MTFRQRTLQVLAQRNASDGISKESLEVPVSDYFNQFVFGPIAKKKYLTRNAYEALTNSIENNLPIDPKIADAIASGLKNWAMDHNATHYTHWFQPLTGKTSEKHDTFFQIDNNGQPIESFSGNDLMVQEPDGSSFPSGGLRSTHEARSYSIWDPTSPPFLRDTKFGKTLCIPAILVAYNGESLDMKAPLLKSVQCIENAALDVCKYFDENVTKVFPTLGWEQEYFIVDESLFNARPDLMLSGRTLFGNAAARGQQLEDHYFGTIPERVHAFITDFEEESLRVGIPIKTRHNEVAPNQFECAPHFETVNIAVDHNLLLMDMIDRVAKRHQLKALLHEKPFKGVNGSGKHNNWSLATNTGKNLLNPGEDPLNDIVFLTFFINTIKAVHENGDLLRAGIANTGNEHRLGANEAPPAIISVFTGDGIAQILEQFKQGKEGSSDIHQYDTLKLEYGLIPSVKRHTTDRNRTSPFPFTGNKFEFRAVGSSANVSTPMTILNTMVADQLINFKKEVDVKISAGTDKMTAIKEILRNYLTESESIIFNGDNYSQEWLAEAAKRGLRNVVSTPEALEIYLEQKNIDLFVRNDIFSAEEVKARYNVFIDEYLHKIEIEATLIDELCRTMIIPSVVNYQNELIKNVQGLKEIGLIKESETHKTQLIKISSHLENIIKLLEQMEEEEYKAHKIDDRGERAKYHHYKIKSLFDLIREQADKLEQMIDDKHWPLPKYRELLFLQ